MLKNSYFFPVFYFVIFLLLMKFAPFIITALFLGAFFATVVDVPERIFKKFLPTRLSRIIANFLVLGMIAFAIGNFFPIVISEGKKIFDSLQKIEIAQFQEIDIPGWLIEFINDLNKYITDVALKIINDILSNAPSLMITIIVVIITTFIIGKLKIKMKDNLHILFPVDNYKGILLIKKSYRDFEAFVKGQVLIAFFEGVWIGVACLIFGIPGALFLAVLTGIGNFIPFLGVIIASVPLMMLSYSANGLMGLIIGLIVLLIANQLETWLLQPKIQGNTLHIHWFIILTTIFLFSEIFGFIGVLVALPVIIYVKNFWKIYVLNLKN